MDVRCFLGDALEDDGPPPVLELDVQEFSLFQEQQMAWAREDAALAAQELHGRALAVATAIKRLRPQNIVFTYQGDGDLAAIGTNETIHTANRGENLTVIFINNAVYGMTGGQMAPTTLVGQKTATTPKGRDGKTEGYPLKISEILASLAAVKYVERVSLHSPAEVLKAKKAVKQAFQNQMDNVGFSLVELLSPCPTYWGLSPQQAVEWMRDVMAKEFPLGRIK